MGADRTPEDIVQAAANARCLSISYTYTEPTVYFEFALDTARLARAAGIKNTFVTNGYINPEPLEMIRPYLDAANIDLKSFCDDFYRTICGARLQPVLEAIRSGEAREVLVALDLVLVKTVPGGAAPVAQAIDDVRWNDVAGTLAGEDTILVVPRTRGSAGPLLARLRALLPP